MKIQRRITDTLTIYLDLTGIALEMALEDGYTPVNETPVEDGVEDAAAAIDAIVYVTR